jgi:hypothetical protein
MSSQANYIPTSNNQPAALLEAQTRVAQLEAQLEQADYFIVNALESSVGHEDMCRKLRMAHDTLKQALKGKRNQSRVA